MSKEDIKADYELDDEANEILPKRWLIIIALIVWGGAWWLK